MTHPHHGRPILPTAAAVRIVVDAVAPLTTSAVGNISGEDAGFLLSLLAQSQPSHILEIGVASGTSTLMMLRMLESMASPATLLSVDLAPAYYVDPSREVAFLVTENYHSPPANWRLLTEVGAMNFAQHPSVVGEDQRRRFDFIFIDAHHGHPWPTLDLLCLLPYATPGAWVALHDINLPVIAEPSFGADYVLRDWPREPLISDEVPVPNIGAIRLSDAGEHDAQHLLRVLNRPWDCGIHPFNAQRIFAHLKTFLAPVALEQVRRAFDDHRDLEPG